MTASATGNTAAAPARRSSAPTTVNVQPESTISSNRQGQPAVTGGIWEAAQQFCGKFQAVNFASEKPDIGFTLMNQLAVAEKRFPRSQRDVASDFFALRKHYTGSRWLFTEGINPLNAASHCDIAWAGGLASKAHRMYRDVGGAVA